MNRLPLALSFSVVVVLAHSASAQVRRYAVVPGFDSDTLSVVDVDAMVEVADLPTMGVAPREVAVSPLGDEAYVMHASGATLGTGDISVIDLETLTFARHLAGVIPNNTDLAITPDGRYLFAASQVDTTLYRYDLENQAAAAATLALAPGQGLVLRVLALHPSDDSRYVFVNEGDRITQVDAENLQVAGAVHAGGPSQYQAVDVCVERIAARPGRYTVSWVRNVAHRLQIEFSTWNTATGEVRTALSPFSGIGFDIAVDRSAGVAAIAVDQLAPETGRLEGGIQLWDLDSATYLGQSFGSRGAGGIRDLQFSRGLFVGIKYDTGVNAFDARTGRLAVARSTSPSLPTVLTETRMTRDDREYVFTTLEPGTNVSTLTIFDTANERLRGPLPVSAAGLHDLELAETNDAPKVFLVKRNGRGTTIRYQDLNGLADLDVSTLSLVVDGDELGPRLAAWIAEGLAVSTAVDDTTLVLALLVDLTSSSVSTSVCDRNGLCGSTSF